MISSWAAGSSSLKRSSPRDALEHLWRARGARSSVSGSRSISSSSSPTVSGAGASKVARSSSAVGGNEFIGLRAGG